MEPTKMLQIGRLAMREEGDHWNAYWASPTSMEGSTWLGSIRMVFVRDNEVRRAQFLAVMRESFADAVEEKFGTRPTFASEMAAPEHERTRRG